MMVHCVCVDLFEKCHEQPNGMVEATCLQENSMETASETQEVTVVTTL